MTIGERIHNRRLEVGLSVDELAKILGKNRATVYRYESDDIQNLPLGILGPLSDALQTTPAYLVGWEKENAPAVKDEGKGRMAIMTELASNLSDQELDEIISLIQWKLSKR